MTYSVSEDTATEDATLRSEAGSLAVPTGFLGQRPQTQTAGAPGQLEQSSAAERTRLRDAQDHRIVQRTDFWRMRALLWVADGVVAAVAVLAAALNKQVLVVVPLLWLAMMAVRSTRDGRIADLKDLRPFAKSNANFVLAVTLAAILVSDLNGVRAALVMSASLCGVGLVNRWLLGRPAVRQAAGIDVGESIVVVGDLTSVARTISEWEHVPLHRVVGVCLSESDFGPEEVNGVPVLGSVADVAALTKRMHIDVVAVHDVDKLGGLQLAKLQWALEDVGTQLSIITPMTNTIEARARVRTVGRRLMVDLAYSRPQGIVALLKGAIDRIVAAVCLVVFLPLMAAAALLLRLDSPGPVVFKQTRVREHGRTFTMYKLRTMTVDAEDRLAELLEQNEVGGGLFKMREDPRITAVGKWLRRLSLDELPQLWNVVRGDMSLIGPRPALPHEVASYDDTARRRLAVKPGLTGLWQVSGRSNLSWDETVRIDSDYVDNWRPARDVSIAIRTVKAVLSKDGAR